MTVSTEILAVLVTINCAIMTATCTVMWELWRDQKKLRIEHGELRVELQKKADKGHDCKEQQTGCRNGLINHICGKLKQLQDENSKQHAEIWERVNHHDHDDDDGKVIIR